MVNKTIINSVQGNLHSYFQLKVFKKLQNISFLRVISKKEITNYWDNSLMQLDRKMSSCGTIKT